MGVVIGATFIIWLLVVIIALGARSGDKREIIMDQQLSPAVDDAEEKSRRRSINHEK